MNEAVAQLDYNQSLTLARDGQVSKKHKHTHETCRTPWCCLSLYDMCFSVALLFFALVGGYLPSIAQFFFFDSLKTIFSISDNHDCKALGGKQMHQVVQNTLSLRTRVQTYTDFTECVGTHNSTCYRPPVRAYKITFSIAAWFVDRNTFTTFTMLQVLKRRLRKGSRSFE